MDSIVSKAKKEYFKYNNRPMIQDIFSIKGFLKYFYYRTSMPFIRDILFMAVDTIEIYLLFLWLGKDVSTGGIIAYATGLISLNIWQVAIFSIREKMLRYRKLRKDFHISYYIFSYFAVTLVLWGILISSFFYFIPFNSPDAQLIFVNKTISNVFIFMSISYFFTAYSISRIYIPFWSTVLAKLSGLAFIVLSFNFLGIYSFITGFYIEKVLGLTVMVYFINKSYRKRRIKPFEPLPSKKVFWKKIKELSIGKLFLRFISFLIYNLQLLFVILFVKSYNPRYLLEFFMFYQILRILLLPAKRMGKALFYDLTTLTIFKDFNTKKRLLIMNAIVLTIFAILSSFIFYSMLTQFWYPKRYGPLIFEIYMLGNIKYFYYFIFFSSFIIVLKKVLRVLEVHIPLIISIIVFEFILIFYYLYGGGALDKYGSPLIFFVVAGKIYFWYILTLLSILITPLWKKLSIIYKVSNINESLKFDPKNKLLKDIEKGAFVLFLKKDQRSKLKKEQLLKLIQEKLNPQVITKLSYNNIIISAISKNELKINKADILTVLAPFITKIFFINSLKNLAELNHFIYSFLGKFYEIENIKDIFNFLNKKNIKYKLYNIKITDHLEIKGLHKSKKAKEIVKFLKVLNNNDYLIPEKIIFKPEYIGLIPFFKNHKLIALIEVETKDMEIIIKIIKSQVSNNQI